MENETLHAKKTYITFLEWHKELGYIMMGFTKGERVRVLLGKKRIDTLKNTYEISEALLCIDLGLTKG